MDDGKPEVVLSWKEQEKLKVLQEILSGTRTQVSAARTLGITDRWVRTLVKRLKSRGAQGLVHGNRGRTPVNRVSNTLRQRVLELYRDRYEGFNLTHFREMLQQREGLQPPCRESLRQMLQQAGLWSRSRKAPKHRLRRPRRLYEGELLQMDASIHRWVGTEGPFWALVGAIDDATGDVPAAQFFESETREAYFTVLGKILQRRGIPRAVYTDRDSVFVVNTARDRELLQAQGRLPETQFGRALRELGIEWIPAYSPQAKGRIERLWGVFQDRLRNELRLEGIQTISEANAYLQRDFLPRYTRQFRRPAARAEVVYRPAPPKGQREAILCWKESRVLARDHTFSLEAKVWQVLPSDRVPALTGRRIEVRRTLRGEVQAWYGAVQLQVCPAPPRAPLQRALGARAPLAAAYSFPHRGKVWL